MKQQINLYQPIFRKQQIIFSAQTIAWLALGLLLLLVVWSLLISQRVGALERQLDNQRAAEQRVMAQITELGQDQPDESDRIALEQEIERLNQRRTDLRQSLAAMHQRQPVADSRLHERYDALARQRPAGLWLTELRLDEQHGDIAMRGRALAARLLPAYLDALSSEPLISGTGFRQVRLYESVDEIPGVIFSISTAAETGR